MFKERVSMALASLLTLGSSAAALAQDPGTAALEEPAVEVVVATPPSHFGGVALDMVSAHTEYPDSDFASVEAALDSQKSRRSGSVLYINLNQLDTIAPPFKSDREPASVLDDQIRKALDLGVVVFLDATEMEARADEVAASEEAPNPFSPATLVTRLAGAGVGEAGDFVMIGRQAADRHRVSVVRTLHALSSVPASAKPESAAGLHEAAKTELLPAPVDETWFGDKAAARFGELQAELNRGSGLKNQDSEARGGSGPKFTVVATVTQQLICNAQALSLPGVGGTTTIFHDTFRANWCNGGSASLRYVIEAFNDLAAGNLTPRKIVRISAQNGAGIFLTQNLINANQRENGGGGEGGHWFGPFATDYRLTWTAPSTISSLVLADHQPRNTIRQDQIRRTNGLTVGGNVTAQASLDPKAPFSIGGGGSIAYTDSTTVVMNVSQFEVRNSTQGTTAQWDVENLVSNVGSPNHGTIVQNGAFAESNDRCRHDPAFQFGTPLYQSSSIPVVGYRNYTPGVLSVWEMPQSTAGTHTWNLQTRVDSIMRGGRTRYLFFFNEGCETGSTTAVDIVNLPVTINLSHYLLEPEVSVLLQTLETVDGECLRADSDSSGASVSFSSLCDFDDPAFLWGLDGNNRYRSRIQPDRCLTVSPGLDELTLEPCDSLTLRQQWQWEDPALGDRLFSLTSGGTYAIDFDEATSTVGLTTQGGERLSPVLPPATSSQTAPPSVSLRSHLNENKCLDVYLAQTAAGTNVMVYDCNGTAAQPFHLDAEDNQLIYAQDTSKCLAPEGSIVSQGRSLKIENCASSGSARLAQTWILDANGLIRNGLDPSQCVDIVGSNTANSTDIIMWPCHGGANQRWSLYPEN